MRSRRGNLGFGGIASGSISGPHTPTTLLTSDHPTVFKFSGYAVLDASISEDSGAVTKLNSYALLDASLHETTVGITDFRAYGVFDASLHETTVAVTDFRAYGLYLNLIPTPIPPSVQPPRRRFKLGMAEYSHTAGFDPYLLRGAIPAFETFRSQLIDGERFRYRAVSGVKQEVGEAIFDWAGNRIIRVKAQTPKQMVEWSEGRKIIHFVEDDGIRDTDPKLLIGVAEYTNTTGLDPYALRGALNEYETLRAVLPHGVRVRYRATNNAKEEIGDGTFDSVSNLLFRHLTTIPSNLITWGTGRKLIYITEIY